MATQQPQQQQPQKVQVRQKVQGPEWLTKAPKTEIALNCVVVRATRNGLEFGNITGETPEYWDHDYVERGRFIVKFGDSKEEKIYTNNYKGWVALPRTVVVDGNKQLTLMRHKNRLCAGVKPLHDSQFGKTWTWPAPRK